ncbi:amidohydrolase family protein [Nesterenkonia alkaliphila]|uniref:Amidohydrolase family protein n=1 Tax=Nesterenkonia alkaliphila TaxID=1463631 RepID=A0A7K1UG87_9MICC|nr:hypothetical protein [Nesterenkonia alkaliphila]MVT25477.1 hypothetical protein [Nesterenkonia alkaliphila]GFZ96576.1 hypothetical protein GCM10011359_27560 [Nesterenkonia alkaliphila]
MADLTIRNATLITEPGASPLPGAALEMRSGVITRISQGALPTQGEEYDAAGSVVVPGFWNCHVHLTEPQWARAAKAPAGALQPDLDGMFLARGFTAAVDLGSDPRSTNAVKARVASGELAGPRLLSAGAGIYPPRGLPFYVRDEIPRYVRMMIPQPRGATGARMAVRRSQRNGA